MAHRDSNATSMSGTGRKSRKSRCKSASEIARNVNHFEMWVSYQGCQDVSFHDIPEELKADVKKVFDVKGQLPNAWLDKSTEAYKSLQAMLPSDFVAFIVKAHEATPKLFSSKVMPEASKDLLCDLQSVFSAWTRLQKMRRSSKKWSEADYVANVYNVFRSPAIHESDYRASCSISLAQPLAHLAVSTESVRVLNAKTAFPDSAIFIPAGRIRDLSLSAKSPFKVLKEHPRVAGSGSVGGESSFRFQSTPCTKLPDTPGFEFASAFWEDKKPVHHLLEDAHRQNRIATTSAVRQLHSLHVQAPVFGLVWAQGTVRAHVDWWTVEKNKNHPTIRSAAYPGPKNHNRRTSGIFHEWHLDEPNDILQVFLLIRNMDRWTVGGFRDRVIAGINQLVCDVVQQGHKFTPWKRKGDVSRLNPNGVPENSNSSVTPASSPKRRNKKRAHRPS
ncbi:hypothetical protein AcV7_000735 [Taiwanofungus camphoratus]|nr:hypothetical protein AcV7_000735 [Antrodia cinnamomea]